MADSESYELEELRRRRMQQLAQQQAQQQIQEAQVSEQIKLILTQILTPEARSRLGNIRVARPAFARQVEILLIQLHQAGRLPSQLDDTQFKEILAKLSSSSRKKEIKIQR